MRNTRIQNNHDAFTVINVPGLTVEDVKNILQALPEPFADGRIVNKLHNALFIDDQQGVYINEVFSTFTMGDLSFYLDEVDDEYLEEEDKIAILREVDEVRASEITLDEIPEIVTTLITETVENMKEKVGR